MKSKTRILIVAITIATLLSNASLLTLGHATSAMPSPTWRTKTAMPTARGQTAVVSGNDGLIYVMGGFSGGAPLTTVEAYNPLTDKWIAKAPMPNATRGAAVAKAPNGIIYVIGGFNGVSLTTVQAYNTTSNTWNGSKTGIPTGVWMAGAATGNDGKIYVIGGEKSGGSVTNSTQVYDPTIDRWVSATNMTTARSLLGVAKSADGLIYAMGGYNGSALSVVEAYNPSTNTWTTRSSMPMPKLEFGVSAGSDGNIYVMGGGTSYGNNVGPFFNTVEIYDPKANTWTIPGWAESTMPTARKELSAAIGTNGRIYAVGGANGAYISVNQEASISIPDNIPPTAYIDSITPDPATRGQTITFTGHGSDTDGSVTAYKWKSSLNGTLSTSSTFSVNTLAVGTHTIYFSVEDNSGAWSTEAMSTVTVNSPVSEDPTYQQLLKVNQTLNTQLSDLKTRSDNLTQANADLKTKADALADQNTKLTDNINTLTQKLDSMNLMLLGLGIITIALVAATIALTLLTKRKPAAAAT